MKRTDKFRPSVIDPSKFVLVSQHYLGPIGEDLENSGICEEMAEEQRLLEDHQAAHPGYVVAGHKWPGQCDCCGARYLWGSTFHTAESNTYISIGNICAGKLNLGDPAAMKSFREQVNTWKIHNERVAKARAYLATVGLLPMLELYLSKDNSAEFPERTLRDMCGKVVQWGNELSEKQRAFAVKLLAQIADRPRIEAERAARDEARKPLPVTDKRVTVEGVIISAKYSQGGWEDGKDFFQPEGFKITVEHADGWKAWGSLPKECEPPYGYDTGADGKRIHTSGDDAAATLKGKRIRFDARLTVSDKDAKFGFFKRPTKAAILDMKTLQDD